MTPTMNRYYRFPGGNVLAMEHDTPFPPLHRALHQPNGLLAVGGDLSPQRLLQAYSQGIFPWFSPGEPILWWSPAPRMVLFPERLKISRSLNKRLNKQDYEIRLDSAFRAVMEGCANAPRGSEHGTWIVPEIIDAYCTLHEMGYAHSVETWIDDELAGGLYGVAIGGMFYGESMFHRVSDASKIAFVHLVKYLRQHHFGMIDCQMKTRHLSSLGAHEIPRPAFINKLHQLVRRPHSREKWSWHHDAAE